MHADLQRHDSIPAPAGETPNAMRVLCAEGSRGAGGAGRGSIARLRSQDGEARMCEGWEMGGEMGFAAAT